MKKFYATFIFFVLSFLGSSLQAANVTITVKELTGDTTEFAGCNASDTIQDIKERIASEKGIPQARQRLIFRAQELEDGDILSNLGIGSKATLHLVVRRIIPTPPLGSSSRDQSQMSSIEVSSDSDASSSLGQNHTSVHIFFNPKNWPGLVQFGVGATIILGIIGTTIYIFIPKSKKEKENINEVEEEEQNPKNTPTQRKALPPSMGKG